MLVIYPLETGPDKPSGFCLAKSLEVSGVWNESNSEVTNFWMSTKRVCDIILLSITRSSRAGERVIGILVSLMVSECDGSERGFEFVIHAGVLIIFPLDLRLLGGGVSIIPYMLKENKSSEGVLTAPEALVDSSMRFFDMESILSDK